MTPVTSRSSPVRSPPSTMICARNSLRSIRRVFLGPRDGDHALWLALGECAQVGAGRAVDDDATPTRHEADDLIAGQRITAGAKSRHQPRQPGDARACLLLARRGDRRGSLRRGQLRRRRNLQSLAHLRQQRRHAHAIARQRHQQRVGVGLIELAGEPAQIVVADILDPLAQPQDAQFAVEALAPDLQVDVALMLFEIFGDVLARRLRAGEAQPVACGVRVVAAG